MVQRVRDANRATQAIPRAGAPPRKGDPSARRPPPGTHPSAAARRGGPSKARDIKRLAMEVGMESMRQCLEDIGVELLRDEVWTQLKRVVPLEDEWRPQISLLAAMGFRAADLERLVDAREDILLFKPKVSLRRRGRSVVQELLSCRGVSYGGNSCCPRQGRWLLFCGDL